jgi:hypothetical protein
MTDPVETLAGTTCRWCERADLRRGTYKDDRALVCPDCGTPAVRLF